MKGKKKIILISCVVGAILLNLFTAFFLVRRAKATEAPVRECAFKRAQWMEALEQIEWNLRRWEMQAPLCLERGASIVQRMEKEEGFRVWDFESSQTLARDTATSTMIIPSNHSFLTGRSIWLCGESGVAQATLASWSLGGEGLSALSVEWPSKDEAHAFTKGTTVAQAVARELRLIARQDGSGFTLVSQGASESPKPILSAISSFEISMDTKSQLGEVPVRMQVRSGDCELRREFALRTSYPDSSKGKWLVSEGALVLSP